MTGNANAVYSVATNSTSPFTTTGNSGTTLTLSDGIHHGIDADASSSPSTFVETYFPGSASAFDLVGIVGRGERHLTVTYDYTPVPLPAALPLLLSGFAGLRILTRRPKVARACSRPEVPGGNMQLSHDRQIGVTSRA